MAGNSFGQLFRITTFGESHGVAMGVVIDGVPPRMSLSEADIQKDLDRRRPGQSSITTKRREIDKAEILSGVFEGKTTGTPIAILIRNADMRSQDYASLKKILRPGHADLTYLEKFGIRDHRGGGRASGRETVCRVAAGAVARRLLSLHKIQVIAYTTAVGEVIAQKRDFKVIEKNPVRAPDLAAAAKMVARIEQVREAGNSIGGIVEAMIKGCPPGLGDPVFDKMNARIAYALMSIGAVRGIEFGSGFGAAFMMGSEHNDSLTLRGKQIRGLTNHSGGILGGITTGDEIILRIAIKPPSSIACSQRTVTTSKKATAIQIKGRHDPCLCPRVVPVVEAMLAITLADAYLIQKSIS
jgi:chorismate synthase